MQHITKRHESRTQLRALEEPFVGQKVILDGVEGTVTGYEADEETRTGTWTITYSGHRTKEVKKAELLAAWRRYRGTGA